MKGRLLLGLLVIATVVLWMYYKLTLLNPGLVSGFVVLGTTIIVKVINSAEDILVALFKVGDLPKPIVAPPASPAAAAPKILPLLLICGLCLVFTGCASYNQKAICLQLGTTNASIPYVGGASNGSGYACYYSCIGPKCPIPDTSTITAMMEKEAAVTNNSIVTSGPVKITATPIK